MKKYKINEIFYSLQGEGVRAGTPNVFVRFSGCNLDCKMAPGPRSPGGFDCDTDFESGTFMTCDEILEEIVKQGGKCKNIIFTGGEPTLQLDKEILIRCKMELDAYLAIETNGTRKVPMEIDWVCVSPKVGEGQLVQREADEVKYVIKANQPIPVTTVLAKHYLISPASDKYDLNKENMQWCIYLVRENPTWRLSCQLHKLWKVR